jgi:hypothetical protein
VSYLHNRAQITAANPLDQQHMCLVLVQQQLAGVEHQGCSEDAQQQRYTAQRSFTASSQQKVFTEMMVY